MHLFSIHQTVSDQLSELALSSCVVLGVDDSVLALSSFPLPLGVCSVLEDSLDVLDSVVDELARAELELVVT